MFWLIKYNDINDLEIVVLMDVIKGMNLYCIGIFIWMVIILIKCID